MTSLQNARQARAYMTMALRLTDHAIMMQPSASQWYCKAITHREYSRLCETAAARQAHADAGTDCMRKSVAAMPGKPNAARWQLAVDLAQRAAETSELTKVKALLREAIHLGIESLSFAGIGLADVKALGGIALASSDEAATGSSAGLASNSPPSGGASSSQLDALKASCRALATAAAGGEEKAAHCAAACGAVQEVLGATLAGNRTVSITDAVLATHLQRVSVCVCVCVTR